MKIMIAKRKLY